MLLTTIPYVKRGGLPVCHEAGVYVIRNIDNGKIYIGSAVSIRQRFLYHRSYLRRGKHDNEYLQRAWAKYGEETFEFDVVEICDVELCVEREQWWIDNLEACVREKGYNIALAGKCPMSGRKHSEESRAKMSARHKGMDNSRATAAAAIANRGKERPEEVRAKIGTSQKGKAKSEEHRARVKANHWSKRPDAAEIAAKSASANRGKKHSEEHKAKIGASHWSNGTNALEIAARLAAKMAGKNRGRKHSPEVRAKMSVAQRARRARAKLVQASESEVTVLEQSTLFS